MRIRAAARALAAWTGVGLPGLLMAPIGPDAVASAPVCERPCLEHFVDRYLDAMIAHDPSKVPFAPEVKFTQNGQRLELGDGLWRSITAKGTYRMFVADVTSGHVAFLGSIRDADTPAMLALHLRIRKDQITAAEMLVQRSAASAQGFEEIGYTWRDSVAGGSMSREELLKTANTYFSGVQQNDGKDLYPLDHECNRIENGTSWGCLEQLRSGALRFVSRIRDRRFVAVDPERGLVFSYVFFDQMNGPQPPQTQEVAEAFRIERGRIRQILALTEAAPYGMNSGWSSWTEGMSGAARDASR